MQKGWALGTARIVAALLLLSGSPPSSRAFAQEQEQAIPLSPRDVLRQGVRTLAAGRADEAIVLLERAERAGAGPLAAYNLGLAYHRRARLRDALLAWERYVAAPEPGAPDERLGGVREELATMRAALAELVVEHTPTNAIARITGHDEVWDVSAVIDGERRRLHAWLDPGSYALVIASAGHQPHERALVLVAGQRLDVVVALAPTPSESAARAPAVSAPPLRRQAAHPSRSSRARPRPSRDAFASSGGGVPWWTWIGVASVVLGAGVATGLIVDGGSRADEWSDRCDALPGDAECERDRMSLQGTLDGFGVGIVTAIVIGAVGLGVTTAGLVVGTRSDPPRPRLSWAPSRLVLRW